jgi:hypothetical protein
MTIERNRGVTFLQQSGCRYGGSLVNPSFKSDFDSMDVFSGELPVSRKKEYEQAEVIGKKHGLQLVFQDFSFGDGAGKGMEPDYELVFAISCKSFEELENAPKRIEQAMLELEKQIE